MNDVIKYNKAIIEIGAPFIGIPDSHSSLIKSMILLADPVTGIVNDISYNDLAKILTINPAPGRKDSGTPTKQTIRNYIKTIERECGDYFKVISEGQSLKFIFPKLPKIFTKILGDIEVNTGSNTNEILENTKKKEGFEEEINTDFNTEVNIADSSVKKLFININNKINNNNMDENIANRKVQKIISKNFYPSQEIIARAIAAGHNNATDPEIIQEFIDKNTAWGSTFADFNPIYLSFLAKHAQRKQQESLITITHTRSKDNERSSPKINSYDRALEEVRRNNQNACKPSTELYPGSKAITLELEHASHFMALGGADQDLRRFVSY